MKLRFVSLVILFFALSSMLMFSVSATVNKEVSISIISEAEHSMERAYEVVLDAERVGADVSGLLVRLNDGGAMLSQAHMAFEVGDFEEATRFAESTSEVGREVVNEAELLGIEANNAQVKKARRFLIFSASSVSTVIVASILGYQYFKGRYYKRLSKMKPKVR